MRTKKLVNTMTMMIWDEVEVEGDRWCTILVNETQNQNVMTEKASPGNGAEVQKLVMDICQ